LQSYKVPCILWQVASPEKAGAYKERPSKDTQFKKFYERGDFPIALENDKKGNKIAWKVHGETFILKLCVFY